MEIKQSINNFEIYLVLTPSIPVSELQNQGPFQQLSCQSVVDYEYWDCVNKGVSGIQEQ